MELISYFRRFFLNFLGFRRIFSVLKNNLFSALFCVEILSRRFSVSRKLALFFLTLTYSHCVEPIASKINAFCSSGWSLLRIVLLLRILNIVAPVGKIGVIPYARVVAIVVEGRTSLPLKGTDLLLHNHNTIGIARTLHCYMTRSPTKITTHSNLDSSGHCITDHR